MCVQLIVADYTGLSEYLLLANSHCKKYRVRSRTGTLHICAVAWDRKECNKNNEMVVSVYLYRSARLNSAVVWPGSR